MIKTIAIDDEYSTLKLLPHIINWAEYGFELTKTFSDAEHAFEYICANDVDVVITDICMPNTNGIEFAEKLCASFPNITIVFLSAHKNFEFAHSAIKYGVFDYLTKPLDFDELENLLVRLSKSVRMARQMKNSYTIYEKQQLLIDFVSEKTELCDFIAALNLDEGYRPECSPAAILKITTADLVTFLKTKWAYGIDRLYSCLIRFLESDKTEVVPLKLSLHHTEIIIFSKHAMQKEDFTRLIEQVQSKFSDTCREELTLGATMEISDIFPGLTDAQARLYDMQLIPGTPPQQKSNNAIEKALEYIRNHLSSDISLADVAGSVYMSPYHFSRMFKAHQNENFSDFVLKKRLEYAQTLLKTGKYTISQIAEMTGFMNRNYFHRVFKHNIGCTPKEYIQAELNKDTRK